MQKSTLPAKEARAEERARGYTAWQRVLNVAGIVAFVVLAWITARRIGVVADESAVRSWGWLVAAAFALGLPCADLFSGLVHWSADNWGTERWPILGGFVQPFRNHHRDPLDMTRHGFIERHGDPCIFALPTFWWASMVEGGPAWQLFGNAFWLGTAWWVLMTNQIHAWAHREKVPRVVRLLQRMRLILSPEHHAEHHRPPYARNYCITTGWMDGPMRWFRVWDALEWIITKITGKKPLHVQIAARQRADAAERSASIA